MSKKWTNQVITSFPKDEFQIADKHVTHPQPSKKCKVMLH